MSAAVRLFVGGHAATIGGERYDLAGDRCFTAAWKPERHGFDPATATGLLDSGAFTDPPARRLTPALALDRQLSWEVRASGLWGAPWRAYALVSYDLLIDEVWTGQTRVKRRWSVQAADTAVRETVEATRYLASQRERLAPRILVLSIQGVDAFQQRECLDAILPVTAVDDWIGLGGWCILGRWLSWLPEFWRTLQLCLPRIAHAGVRHVHIFGVLFLRALGGLVWLADRYGLTVSTDSTAPVLACTRGNARKAGVRAEGWRANVEWWRETLADLRKSTWYREPAVNSVARQLELFGEEEWA